MKLNLYHKGNFTEKETNLIYKLLKEYTTFRLENNSTPLPEVGEEFEQLIEVIANQFCAVYNSQAVRYSYKVNPNQSNLQKGIINFDSEMDFVEIDEIFMIILKTILMSPLINHCDSLLSIIS